MKKKEEVKIMKKFDYKLTRDKQYYLDKMAELDRDYAKRENIIGKNYIKGVHFKPQGDFIFGHYSNHGYHRIGFVVPFRAKFEYDDDSTLHFRGMAYPYPLTVVLILILIFVSLFLAKRADITVFALFFLAVDLMFFLRYSNDLFHSLEEFFV